MVDKLILLGLTLSTCFMSAVGAYVGWVHYPGFNAIAPNAWGEFHAQHCQSTGMIVMGPMLLQLGLTIAVMVRGNWSLQAPMLILQVVLLAFSFGWTMLVSAPIHDHLRSGYDLAAIQRLIGTNWPRVLAWAAQSLLCGWLLLQPSK